MKSFTVKPFLQNCFSKTIYGGSRQDEVRGVEVEPTGAQGALLPELLYSIDMKTAILAGLLAECWIRDW